MEGVWEDDIDVQPETAAPTAAAQRPARMVVAILFPGASAPVGIKPCVRATGDRRQMRDGERRRDRAMRLPAWGQERERVCGSHQNDARGTTGGITGTLAANSRKSWSPSGKRRWTSVPAKRTARSKPHARVDSGHRHGRSGSQAQPDIPMRTPLSCGTPSTTSVHTTCAVLPLSWIFGKPVPRPLPCRSASLMRCSCFDRSGV